jgi:hypothetical protein
MNKQNQQGVIHHLTLIVMGIAVLGAISFAGFRVWQNKSDAAAGSGLAELIRISGRKAYGGKGGGDEPNGNGSYAIRFCRDSANYKKYVNVFDEWTNYNHKYTIYSYNNGSKSAASSFSSTQKAGEAVKYLCTSIGQ